LYPNESIIYVFRFFYLSVQLKTLDDLALWMWERRYPLLFLSIVIVLSTLVLGSLFFTDLFWDGFIYRYFWAPIVADKEGRPVDGIREGYNVYNTLVYAIILGGALFGVHRTFKRIGLDIEWTFAAACLPLFFLGGTSRALEDAHLYEEGVQFLFISPIIYFVIFGIFISFLEIGYLERKGKRAFEVGMAAHLALLLGIQFLYPEGLNHELQPAVPLLLAVLAMALHRASLSRIGGIRASIFAGGMFYLLLSIAYVVSFPLSSDWMGIYEAYEGAPDPHYLEMAIIPVIAIAITLAIRSMGGRYWKDLAAPMNVLICFGHFMDGAATYRGIDEYGYLEKHVLPSFLIDLTGTAAVMLLLKLVLVVGIIYMLDVLLKEELKESRLLVGLVKATVIFLGLGPGTRDAVRIGLGV
jgi:uncharacterized membrane protein